MKLVANIRLTPSGEEAGVPRRFFERVNGPCNWHKAGAEGPREIRKHAAQPNDDRIVSFRTNHIVSIATPKGRLSTCRKGEVDLARAATLPACPECGVIDDKNRPNQAIFSCRRVSTLATLM